MQAIEQTPIPPQLSAHADGRHSRRRSIDGVARRPKPKTAAVLPQYTVRPAIATPAPAPAKPVPATHPAIPQPAPSSQPRAYAKPSAKPAKRRMPQWLEMTLIVMGAMTAGLLAQSSVVGQILIVAYGVLAFMFRVRSRTTFTLALLAMITTIVMLTLRGNVGLSQNFATYTFLLLVVGVITLGRELKNEGGRVYSRRNY